LKKEEEEKKNIDGKINKQKWLLEKGMR